MVDPTAIAQAFVEGDCRSRTSPADRCRRATIRRWCWSVAKNSPIKTAKDLEGKTVAIISLHATMEIATREVVDEERRRRVEGQVLRAALPGDDAGARRAARSMRRCSANRSSPRTKPTSARSACRSTRSRRCSTSSAGSRGAIGSRPTSTSRIRWPRRSTKPATWANTHRAESALIEAEDHQGRPRHRAHDAAQPALDLAQPPRYIQPLLDMAARYKVIERPVNATDLMYPGFS